MSLVSMPFVGSGQDLGLHIAASVVMIGSIVALGYGFWLLFVPLLMQKKP
ncbi:hypothetical protein [Aliivibrio fischeri]|nr:hypothetical protein [Aliivibrio fischeri]